MSNQSKFKIIEDAVRIGGKGSMRRKHKRVPNSAPTEARRLQATLDKLSLFQMTGIDQMTFLMDDQSELVITLPHVQCSTANNLLVVNGKPTFVGATTSRREPEPGRPPSPCPSTPPPPPPPPPSPASPAFNSKKAAKKPKKPRNRIRLRNKCVREMLLAGAGDFGGEDHVLGSAEDLLFGPGYMVDGGGGDSDDSDKTTVPSEGSDMNLTIVAVDSLERLTSSKKSDDAQTGNEEIQDEETEVKSEENGDKEKENEDDYDEGEGEELLMTLEDLLSCLEED